MSEIEKIATPRGEARTMTTLEAASRQFVDQSGSGWMGPGAPPAPLAGAEVAGRAFDYPVGYNLNSMPRAYEPVSFHTLRALADSYDPVRLIIERRKDQMTRLPWTIRVKHDGKRPKSSEVSAPMRDLIGEVKRFFEHPTNGLNFRTWLRAVLDDLLILDAPAIFCERDGFGNLAALSPVDGSTIRRIINDQGRQPRPFVWNGIPFDFLGQRVTPQNYVGLGFVIADGLLYPPAFQQILKGVPAVNLTVLDLLYSPMNVRTNSVYGRSAVENIITTVSIALRRSMSQLEYFREGNVPEGVFALPESWTPDNVQRFQDYWDSLHSGNLANRRKMKFVPTGKGNAYTALKEPPLKNEFDEWLVRIVCFAFSYPPGAFVSLSNRSVAEQHERTAEEEGLGPLKQWLGDLINGVIQREFDDDTIEFAWLEEAEVDQKVEAEIIERLVTNGIITPNEGRERLGLEPSGNAAANELMVKTATGLIPIGTQKKDVEA